MLPDPVEGFVERAELASRCDLTQRRLTIVTAPGGFGKTTLLADACRRLRSGRGVCAWLTVDEEDDATALAMYLPFAFAEGGLDLLESRVTSHDFEHGDYRINLLMHSIEMRSFPCVLVLDDVDRMQSLASLAIVNQLLRRGPPNLHLAIACRELPPSLDVAELVLERRGVAISANELRFGKSEISRFFDKRLSRRELAKLAESSQGWPIALCVHRNVHAATESRTLLQDIASNWIEARLWRGLSDEERDFVLDLGLFEWVDSDLVDEVLGAGSIRRIRAIAAFSGLLRTVGGSLDALALHPLIRQYCADERFRGTPERYRLIHRKIADALARRGQVIAAMRHAGEASDSELVGNILEAAGGSRFWLRHGMAQVVAADELLTDEILARFPRLGLLRCMVMVMAGELGRARTIYEGLAARTDGFTRDRDGGNDEELQIDDVIYRYLLSSCGCQPIGPPAHAALVSSIEALANGARVDPFVKAVAKYALGEIGSASTNFEDARRWTTRARAGVVRRSRYITMFADFQLGLIAMAQGRVSDAAQAYARAQRAAKNDFLHDAGPAVLAEVLAAELNLERNRTTSLARRSHKMPTLLAECGGWLDVYMASAETVAELALREGGPNAALAELQGIAAFAERTERVTLVRALAGLRVSLLVRGGRIGEARELWASARLPGDVDDLLDLSTQTWREMETIACAALRLSTARRQFDAARELANALLAVCAEKGLKRSLMWARALCMVLEHRAGDTDAARAHLVEYLELFADTDYPRALLQERETSLAVFEHLNEGVIDKRKQRMATLLVAMLENEPQEQAEAVVPTLSPRELEILQRLESWRDKEIGAALALSENGVRYHIKSIFRKLGVRSRFEATRRARSLGILP